MKVLGICLIMVVFARKVEGDGKTCELLTGNTLYLYSGQQQLKTNFPCKFNMITNQQCGSYLITLTPGLKFVYPSYYINTGWLNVTKADGSKYYTARYTNKVTGKYIIGLNDYPVNQKSGDISTTELFDISNTTKDVTLTEKNGEFRVTMAAFDFNGNRHGDSGLSFECFADMQNISFPTQFCGDFNTSALHKYTQSLFKNSKFKEEAVLYSVFTDMSIQQTDERCIEARNLMLNKCTDEEMRKNATRTCSVILTSKPHRNCVLKDNCDLMEVFNACLDFVCGGFVKENCTVLGKAIDMCRRFPGLSEPVKAVNCYNDLLLSSDNPFYVEKDN